MCSRPSPFLEELGYEALFCHVLSTFLFKTTAYLGSYVKPGALYRLESGFEAIAKRCVRKGSEFRGRGQSLEEFLGSDYGGMCDYV